MTGPSSTGGNQTERFAVEVYPERDVVRLMPIGELDLLGADQLAAQVRELHEAGFTHFKLDLRRLRVIDSAGLAMLMKLDRWAREGAIELELTKAPDAVRRLFSIAGVSELLAPANGGGRAGARPSTRFPLAI
jgi:anti-anti-sigma factor